MRVAITLVTLVVAFAAGEDLGRLTQETDIASFPYMVALLRTPIGSTVYQHSCAGSILNNRSVLTAARCMYEDAPTRWRFRTGSNRHYAGGTVHPVTRIALNDFDEWAMLNDIAVVRTNVQIQFGQYVQVGAFAGANYNLADNQPVTTIGWGYSPMPVWQPQQHPDLQKNEQVTVPHGSCAPHYSADGFFIRETAQICSGFANPESVHPINAQDKCLGEPGAPLIHMGTIVGIRSYALSCLFAEVPTISTRVGQYISWISAEA